MTSRYFCSSFFCFAYVAYIDVFPPHSNEMTSWQNSSAEKISYNVAPFFYHHILYHTPCIRQATSFKFKGKRIYFFKMYDIYLGFGLGRIDTYINLNKVNNCILSTETHNADVRWFIFMGDFLTHIPHVWAMSGSLLSYITLSYEYHKLGRHTLAHFHGQPSESFIISWKQFIFMDNMLVLSNYNGINLLVHSCLHIKY
jgi:hypothetical protein